MRKVIDWNRTQERARGMSCAQLHHAAIDCKKAADAWHPTHGEDPDGNEGFYFDELSVYRREQARRKGR